MNKIVLSFLMLLIVSFANAQNETTAPEMADQFRDQGKIYVVIAVISLVFLCLTFFLIYLERKLKRLEKEMQKKN